MKKFYTLIVSLGLMTGLFAQDPHLSMFYSAPLQLNPALTGVFNGTYRISALYRSQWGEVLKDESTNQFRTMTFAGDVRIPIGKNALGIGLEAVNDQVGASNFATTRAGLAVSYIQSLDKWGQHFVVLGIQGDFIDKNFNPANLRLGTQWTGTEWNPDTGPIDPYLEGLKPNMQFFDAGAGLLYFFKGKNNKFSAYAGFSAQHVNEPNQSFADNVVKLNRKYVGHAGVNFPIADQIHLLPKLLVQFQGQSLETLYGFDTRFIFDKFDPSGNAFKVGALFRGVGGLTAENVQGYNAESIVFLAGLEYKTIEFGVSYDINISQFRTATFSRGGFEVSLIYVGKTTKRHRDLNPCPKF